MEFSALVDRPDAIDTIAGWINAEWRELSGRTFEETRERFSREFEESSALPSTIVAVQDDKPVGLATLRKRDSIDWDPGKIPWVCNVFVAPEARGRGVASALVWELEMIAITLGFDEIYLASEKGDKSLYFREGYRTYKADERAPKIQYLMRKALFR